MIVSDIKSQTEGLANNEIMSKSDAITMQYVWCINHIFPTSTL